MATDRLDCSAPAFVLAYAFGTVTCVLIAVLSVVVPPWYHRIRERYLKRARDGREAQQCHNQQARADQQRPHEGCPPGQAEARSQQTQHRRLAQGQLAGDAAIKALLFRRPPRLRPGPSIAIVGAGPGCVDLLTVAAVRAIVEADLVVSDPLVPEQVRSLARGPVIVSRKMHGTSGSDEDNLLAICLQALSENKRVVHLKYGDPLILAGGAEEVLRFRRHNFRPSVIPGLCTSTAAPLLAGIPLTARGIADRFTVCVAHNRHTHGPPPRYPDFDAHTTFVFVLATHKLESLVSQLTMTHGFPPQAPVCIVQRPSTPQQRQLSSTLEVLPFVAQANQIAAPATLVVGSVVPCLLRRTKQEVRGPQPRAAQPPQPRQPKQQAKKQAQRPT